MTVYELQQEILRLKKEQKVCILAHAYQRREVLEVADFTGDSFGLSQQAQKSDADTLIMCGVRFMAETAKLLSPEKKVLLSNSNAGCPMAEGISAQELKGLKKQHPDRTVVAYINTTAEVKALSDVCVTSASALSIVEKLENDKILFIPDPNLGNFVASKVKSKDILVIDGGCPAHKSITLKDVKKARELYPEAKLLIHPECLPEVTAEADFVGSTTGIMDYAKKSEAREFIIGTENSIVEHLSFDFPDKRFYPLSKGCYCKDMLITDLTSVYRCLRGEGEEIILPEGIMAKARKPIDEMLRLG